MGIFRGVGGTGDSTDDGVVDAVTEQAVIATNKATEAATSATSAYNSAQSASTSKDTAITQANAAQASANTASTHASNASTSATSAASSATSATASATTATTKASEASTSATNAATSETNAATSASTATTKASEAATSATTATTKAGEASTSATNAAASATSASTSASTATTKASEAATSAANAASSYDDFDDRYLGAKSSAPSTDNDGDALVTGALYFDTSSNAMKVWSGSAWLDAYASLSGALIATNNLSDLNNVGTARTNLGLGTAATTASTDYATAAQGTTADNALPKSGGAMTGAITTNSTFDGRNVSADGTKLDGIEAGATADQTASEIKTAYESNADTNAFTDADHSKLDGIEASADVTDTTNVTAAGALMDSELTSEASVKALNQGVATTDSPTFAGLTVDTNTFYVDSTNNRVGIGTSSPNYSLHVNESSDNTVRFQITNSSTGTGVGDGFQIIQNGSAQSNKVNLLNYDNSALGIWTNNTERLHITASGNVGIGTSSPDTLLEIVGANPILTVRDTETSSSSTSTTLRLAESGGGDSLGTYWDIKHNPNAALSFLAGTTERLSIDSSGVVTIGGNTVWHAGNDGSGSGLDADTVDSLHATNIVESSSAITSNLDTFYDAQMFGWTTTTTGKPTDNYGQGIGIVSNGKTHNNSNNWITQLGFGTSENSAYFRSKTNSGSWGAWKTFWHSGNDGTGSGLDADTVDGLHANKFLRSDASGTLAGNLTFTSYAYKAQWGTGGSYVTGGPYVSYNLTVAAESGGIYFYSIGQSGEIAKIGRTESMFKTAVKIDSGYGHTDIIAPNMGNPMYIKANDVDCLRLYTNGNVNIPFGDLTVDNGTTTKINVVSDDNGQSELNLYGSSQGTGRVYVGQSLAYGGGIEYNGDGSPATSGASSDRITLYRRTNNSNLWTAQNYVNSNNWSFRGTITQNASDERLKENITPIENALDKVSQLKGVTFDWKDDVEEKGFIPFAKHETGVIAQDVQKVIPDAAVPAPFDENYLTVQHEKIIPLLIESVKELKQTVDTLQARIDELETK